MSPRTPTTRGLPIILGLLLGSIAPVQAETYDANGNVLTRPSQSGTITTTYDELDRLETETGGGLNQTIIYDPNGNRESDGANTYTLAPNSNRILTINGVTQVYDPAGNLLDDGQGQTYTYNAAGRLKDVKINNVLVASYKYNYKGLRTHKITPQNTTLYHYDIQGHLIQTTDPLGTPKQSLHWADDHPIAQVDHTGPTDTIAYLHTDHLNTPRTATDENQRIVWRREGSAFGNTPPEEDPDNDGNLTIINLRLPGQYYDQETGLHYNWNRYYDPSIGRYITSDPIGLLGGLNTYGYVGQNPLSWTDSLGLDVTIDITRTGRTANSNTGTITTTSTVTNTTYSGDFLENRNPPNPNLPTPAGSYQAFVDKRAGRKDRIELIGVPNATDIQIHVANQPSQLEGCFAPGTATNKLDWISNSGNAMDSILDIIKQDGTGNITVNIQNNLPSP